MFTSLQIFSQKKKKHIISNNILIVHFQFLYDIQTPSIENHIINLYIYIYYKILIFNKLNI